MAQPDQEHPPLRGDNCMASRIIACAPSYNEEAKVALSIQNVPRDLVETVLLVDDGSTDGTAAAAEAAGAMVISHKANRGVGAAIRTGIDYALQEGYDIFVIMSGSGKTRADEITRLVAPLLEEQADVVKGSRYIKGGHAGNMPLIRRLGTRGYSFLTSLLVRQWITDASNGFRAFKLSLLNDKRIDLWQDWLDGYALEPYFLFKTVRLGYRVVEVPVTVEYPRGVAGSFTKMRAIVDWWAVTAPLLWLALGLRR